MTTQDLKQKPGTGAVKHGNINKGKKMTESQNTRLDRIEEKIDKLSEAMISLARAEEKLIAMEQKYTAQYERMNRFSEKLDDIERIVQDNSRTVSLIEKLVGAAILAAVGAWATQYFM